MKEIKSYTAAANKGILLNANELSVNLNETIMQEIQAAIPEIAFNRYPDPEEKEILAAYARYKGLKEEQLLAGNGSDQMLGYLIGSFLGKGKTLYTLDPDFSMYDYYASSYEAVVKKHAVNVDEDFSLADFIAEGKQLKADMIMFSNPNNPSGICLLPSEIEQILQAFSDIPVVVDEAYMEFSDDGSALSLIEKYQNLYVTRTMSKAFGFAGARLGFLVSSAENMARLKAAFVPYALNSLTMKAGTIVLSHAAEFEPLIEEIKQQRDLMYDELKEFQSIHFYPSKANFLYGRTDQKQALLTKFAEAGITIRDYAGKDTFRITIGTKELNEKVMTVLRDFEKEFSK